MLVWHSRILKFSLFYLNLNLKMISLNIMFQNSFPVDRCRLKYLSFKKMRVRKSSVRLKDSIQEYRSKKYLKYTEKETKHLTTKVNNVVAKLDSHGNIKQTKENRQTLEYLQEHPDTELQRSVVTPDEVSVS